MVFIGTLEVILPDGLSVSLFSALHDRVRRSRECPAGMPGAGVFHGNVSGSGCQQGHVPGLWFTISWWMGYLSGPSQLLYVMAFDYLCLCDYLHWRYSSRIIHVT